MANILQFLLTIDIKCDVGADIESLVQIAQEAINNEAIFLFRVVGEPRLVGVFEMSDSTIMNKISGRLITEGPFSVTCTPLIPYEKWAEILGVDAKYRGPAPRKLTKKCIIWGETTIEHRGISTEELERLWCDEATSVLKARSEDRLEIELFKVFGATVIHHFIGIDNPADWEGLHSDLPMPKRMGDQIHRKMKIVTKL